MWWWLWLSLYHDIWHDKMICISRQYIAQAVSDKNFSSQYYYHTETHSYYYYYYLLPTSPTPPSWLSLAEVPCDAQLYQLSNKNTDGSCEVSEQKLESCLFLCELKLNLIWTQGFVRVFILSQYFLIEWKCLKYNQELRKCHCLLFIAKLTTRHQLRDSR